MPSGIIRIWLLPSLTNPVGGPGVREETMFVRPLEIAGEGGVDFDALAVGDDEQRRVFEFESRFGIATGNELFRGHGQGISADTGPSR